MCIETERLIIRSTEQSDAKAYIDMASDGSLDEDIFCGCSRDYEEWIPGWIQENIGLDKEDDPMKESIAYTIVEKGMRQKRPGHMSSTFWNIMRYFTIFMK